MCDVVYTEGTFIHNQWIILEIACNAFVDLPLNQNNILIDGI